MEGTTDDVNVVVEEEEEEEEEDDDDDIGRTITAAKAKAILYRVYRYRVQSTQ